MLAVDLDPRFSLTRHLIDLERGPRPSQSVYDLFAGDTNVACACAATQLERVLLIASPGELLERGEQEMTNADYREEILGGRARG